MSPSSGPLDTEKEVVADPAQRPRDSEAQNEPSARTRQLNRAAAIRPRRSPTTGRNGATQQRRAVTTPLWKEIPMRKKLGIGALAIASVAVLLAGCSGGGGGNAQPSETAIDGKGATLTVWVDENRQPAVKAAAADFEKETGAKVELVKKNFGDIRNDFIDQVPTGEGPDITIGAHDWLGALGRGGVVDTIDLGDKASEINPKALQAMTLDGQLYALPYSLEAVALIQNVDLVGEKAPTTWDEMIQMGKDSGAERPFVINTGGQAGDAYTMYGFQTSFGAPVFVQDSSGGYTTEVGMGGSTVTPSPAGSAERQERHRLHLDDGRLRHEQRAVQHRQGRLHDPGTVGHGRRSPTSRTSRSARSPVPDRHRGPVRRRAGLLPELAEQERAAGPGVPRELPRHGRAQKALYDADPRIPAWTSLAESVSSDPITAGFIASAETGEPMPNIPADGFGVGPLERRSGADHQRRRPHGDLEQDGHRCDGSHLQVTTSSGGVHAPHPRTTPTTRSRVDSRGDIDVDARGKTPEVLDMPDDASPRCRAASRMRAGWRGIGWGFIVKLVMMMLINALGILTIISA